MRLLIVCALLLATAADSGAQSAENVAVVINDASPGSRRIGDYYVRVRKIPAPNVIRLETSVDEQITAAEYARTIERPIAQALNREGLHDRILYVVLTKGIPLRIKGTGGRKGTTASVDSELALLYRRLTGRSAALDGPIANPYFLGNRPIREAQPFTHRPHDIFLVARLDGFTVEDAVSLIDRAQTPSSAGRIVLDQRSGGSTTGDTWLAEAAVRLMFLGHGDRTILEGTAGAARDVNDVLGYYSWGSNDPQNRVRRVGMQFVPGALAATFVSTDARTFQAPPDDWLPTGDTTNRKSFFAGSPQSLAGDLIREGVTGLAAHVSEPYLDGAIRPEILFPAYLAGFNLIEAFYLALPQLSWQTTVIGDPLCAPFRKTVLTRAEIEDPVDPQTELPGIFSQRRMDVARRIMKDAPPGAVALTLRAEIRAARGDKDGARRALEEVSSLAPDSVPAQMRLALLYEEAGEHTRANERYRHLLRLQPDNVVALNNLAYSLAVRQNAPDEGLPLARKAVGLSPNSPTIVDTVAWIEHLLGNHSEAARLMGPIVDKSTVSAEIHLHAALIFAAVKDKARAEAQLKEALRLDPDLASRDDVRVLRLQLGARRP